MLETRIKLKCYLTRRFLVVVFCNRLFLPVSFLKGTVLEPREMSGEKFCEDGNGGGGLTQGRLLVELEKFLAGHYHTSPRSVSFSVSEMPQKVRVNSFCY